MPRRARSHQVADLAIEQVGEIISGAGWAWERIRQDYGEDLHVQPCFNEDVEPFRLWLQVKGTENIERLRVPSLGGFRFGFPIGHLVKWITSSDLVACIIWDVGRRQGYCSLPERLGGVWKLMMGRRKTHSLAFSEENAFTGDELERLGWVARMRYYDRRLRPLIDLARHRDTAESYVHARQELIMAGAELLTKLGVLDGNGGVCRRLQNIEAVVTSLRARGGELTEDEVSDGVSYEGMAVTLIVLDMIERRSGEGCSRDLLDTLHQIAIAAMRAQVVVWADQEPKYKQMSGKDSSSKGRDEDRSQSSRRSGKVGRPDRVRGNVHPKPQNLMRPSQPPKAPPK